jgi:hypothetical protein
MSGSHIRTGPRSPLKGVKANAAKPRSKLLAYRPEQLSSRPKGPLTATAAAFQTLPRAVQVTHQLNAIAVVETQPLTGSRVPQRKE